jgi:hypothetical protein
MIFAFFAPNPTTTEPPMNIRKPKGNNFKRKGKMIRKANHGTRPCRGRRNSRMGRGNG